MYLKTNHAPFDLLFSENAERLKSRGCGRINCRSNLERCNPVSDEIQQIIKIRLKKNK